MPDICYDTEEARKKILRFYEERGLHYETEVELERAYEVYRTRVQMRKNTSSRNKILYNLRCFDQSAYIA